MNNCQTASKARNLSCKWPWIVSIGQQIKGLDGRNIDDPNSIDIMWIHQCMGSLVTLDHVLTAAHCSLAVKEKIKQGNVYVKAGTHDLQDIFDVGIQIGRVSSYKIPPDHKRNASYWDISLLKLAKPLKLTDLVRTIPLPSMATPRHQDDNLPLVVSSFQRNGNGASKILNHFYVQVYSESYCNSTHDGQRKSNLAVPMGFTRQLFCGGDKAGSKGLCHGDSGSSAVFFKPMEQRFILMGVAQGGLSCGTKDHPNIYVRISDQDILRWIYNQIGKVLSPIARDSSSSQITGGNCECSGLTRYDTRKEKTVGHCQTKYSGKYWCYVPSDSKCRDKDQTKRDQDGMRYWSASACKKNKAAEFQQDNVPLLFPGQKMPGRNCRCNWVVRHDARKNAIVGHCQTKFRGKFWCYISDNSECRDKDQTRRKKHGMRYYSTSACQNETPCKNTIIEKQPVPLRLPDWKKYV